jgi:hypothetical protein
MLNNVQSEKNGGAGVVASGSNRGVVARNCVADKNGIAGYLAETSARLDVIDSMAAHSPQGIESDTSAEVRASRSTITRNTTNGLFLNGGTILSYGTNEVSANVGNETFTGGGPTLK